MTGGAARVSCVTRLNLRCLACLAVLLIVATGCASSEPVSEAPVAQSAISAEATPAPAEPSPTAAPTEVPTQATTTAEPSATTATASPPPVPTATPAPVSAVPTPPSHPWYECEFFDYPIANVDYRVANIAANDPDGGLVAHVSPGVNEPTTEVLPPGTGELRASECQQDLANNSVWWLLEQRGWVNAAFLESHSPFGAEHWMPGMTNELPTEALPDVIGLEASDLISLTAVVRDTIAAEEFTTVEIGNFLGVDARGGIARLDILGLGDDSVAGYRLQLTIDFVKDADANEILGYRIAATTGRAICLRRVTPDGDLCV